MNIDTSRRSPNYNKHANGSPILITPAGLLLHSGEGTESSDLSWLCNPLSEVSSNYYVARSGKIYELVPDTYRAWHAGPSYYDGLYDWNRAIGIELEHKRGQGVYPQVQLDALAGLCRAKIAQWHIPQSRVAAHRWVAVPAGRKQDPTDWDNASLRAWIAGLYSAPSPSGMYAVLFDKSRVRTGPGTSFPIATLGPGGAPVLLPRDFTFASDGSKAGESVDGNTLWVHVAQPAPWGWISATLVKPL